MTAAAPPPDDPSIVPGLGPSGGTPPTGRTQPLDRSQDPDRYDPSRVPPVPELPRGLDPADDPDRFRPAGQGRSLPELLGQEGTHEGERDTYQWAYGLIAVLGFLVAVSLLFNNVLSP
jgi:hypothetical protein